MLSQRPIAGVGNIYADEALWRAGFDPPPKVNHPAEADRLLAALRAVLAEGIDNGGTTLRELPHVDAVRAATNTGLDCYGRHGEPCRRCGTTLVRRTIDARGTTHCPRCAAQALSPRVGIMLVDEAELPALEEQLAAG